MTDRDHESHGLAFTRRQTLGIAGAAGGALALGGVAGKAISELGGSDEVDAAMVAKSCRLTPEVTEGPFYVQLTDKRGYATIQTVYPGRYTGRATHIHLKVHIGGKARGGTLRGGRVSHTGQLFFAESSNSSVYSVAPYSSDTDSRTLNSSDGIYTQAGGSRAEVRLTGSPSTGYVGRIVVGVNPKRTRVAV
jgi:hypothetical protein